MNMNDIADTQATTNIQNEHNNPEDQNNSSQFMNGEDQHIEESGGLRDKKEAREKVNTRIDSSNLRQMQSSQPKSEEWQIAMKDIDQLIPNYMKQ